MLLERFECWQEVSDGLREKTALLKREAELMLKATGQSVHELRADGQLDKQTLSDVETAVNEALEQSADGTDMTRDQHRSCALIPLISLLCVCVCVEIRRQTEELALNHCQKACVRRRRMMKAQSSEWSHVSDTQTDAPLMMKVRNTATSHLLEILSLRPSVCFTVCLRRCLLSCR